MTMMRLSVTLILTIAALLESQRISLVAAFAPGTLPVPSHQLVGSQQPSLKAATLTSATAVNGDASLSSAVEEDEDTAKANGGTPEIRLNVFEKARTVTSVCTSGTLCTTSGHDSIQGAPFGSFVDYVLDDEGNPVLLMNEMSMHTINIEQARKKCEAEGGQEPPMVTLFTQLSSQMTEMNKGGLQDTSRCSVTGVVEKINANAEDMDMLRMRYALTHTYADQVMDSPKFAFYRLQPKMIYFVGGFGVSSKWVDVDKYKAAKSDILAEEAPEIVRRINRDHGEDLMLVAQHLLDLPVVEKIRATNVDRLGMDLRVTCPLGTRRNKLKTDEFRIGFRIPVISVEDAKSEILKVFQEAWEKGNGFTWSGEEQPGTSVPIMKTAADSLE